MSKLICALALAIGLPVMATDPWTKADTARELVFVAVTTMDWGTTLDINAKYCAWHDWYEQNPLLGRHPSRARINLFIPASMVLHYLVARELSGKWRTIFQNATIVMEVAAVSHNYSIGLRMNF